MEHTSLEGHVRSSFHYGSGNGWGLIRAQVTRAEQTMASWRGLHAALLLAVFLGLGAATPGELLPFLSPLPRSRSPSLPLLF